MAKELHQDKQATNTSIVQGIGTGISNLDRILTSDIHLLVKDISNIPQIEDKLNLGTAKNCDSRSNLNPVHQCLV
jgi:hypothetical protein